MTTKHTPGPWESMQNDPVMVRPGIEAPALNFSVVLFGADDDDGGIRGRTPEEERANARLIAAAPDLLDIAKQCASECAECGGHGFTYKAGEQFTQEASTRTRIECDACADIRDAIKKATGLE